MKKLTTGQKMWLLFPPEWTVATLQLIEEGKLSKTAAKEFTRYIMDKHEAKLREAGIIE